MRATQRDLESTASAAVERDGSPDRTRRRRSSDSYTLTPAEAKHLAGLAAKLPPEPYSDPEAFAQAAKLQASYLPLRLKVRMLEFSRYSSRSGVFLVRGLPVGELPPTPEGNTHRLCGRTVGAKCGAILTAFFGDLVGYEAEAGGALIQDMAPDSAKAGEQISVGYQTELELHVEQAFSPLKPDYVTLTCLRGNPAAKTYALTAEVLLEELDAGEIAELREPLWTIGIDPSFEEFTRDFDLGMVRGPGPILSGSPDDPFLIFDQLLQRGVDGRAHSLLQRLVDVYMARRSSVVLAGGDFLAIDNRRTVHGRSPFTPRFDGRDRWIARAFATESLAESAHARPQDGRIIGARYC